MCVTLRICLWSKPSAADIHYYPDYISLENLNIRVCPGQKGYFRRQCEQSNKIKFYVEVWNGFPLESRWFIGRKSQQVQWRCQGSGLVLSLYNYSFQCPMETNC